MGKTLKNLVQVVPDVCVIIVVPEIFVWKRSPKNL